MRNFAKSILALLVVALIGIGLVGCGQKEENKQAPKEKYTFAISVYAGWMPWYYAQEQGIIKKWADKYNIEIEVVPMSYSASLDAFAAGKVDAVVMTNMEALDVPAAAGVHTSIVIFGDYGFGSDKVLARNGITLQQLKGKDVSALDKSVSVYVLARALEMETNLSLKDLRVVNVSDEEIAGTFLASRSQQVAVTWNPMALEILDGDKSVREIFNTTKIPGEVQDLTVVNTAANGRSKGNLARALNGAWYETLGLIQKDVSVNNPVIRRMAELSKATPENFVVQLNSIKLFWTPAEAVAFVSDKAFQEKMDRVRQFCFSYGLLGENAKSVDVVGIKYPDGTIQGDVNNVQLVYDVTYMIEARDGKLK